MTEPVWRIAGRYRVMGRIGSGGMADVLRAHDELLDRDVAVKVFRSVPTAPGTATDTASGEQRQRAELTALAQLNHPNLTMLYDGSIVGQDGPAYLVMELIDGPSLAQAITEGGLPAAQTRIIGAQIADALDYVHAAGMVHRDVKPANILLGTDRRNVHEGVRARLTDFGIVRLVGSESLTQVDMTLGSASYLAPEQARGSAVGPPADVYALGLTLIEALTGRRSFDGPVMEAVVARLTHDPEIPAGLAEPWPDLLRAMTARDPAVRPTARRVGQVLRGAESVTAALGSIPAGTNDTAVLPRMSAVPVGGYASAAGATGRRVGTPPGTDEARRRVPVSLIVAGVLVLALLIAGGILLVSGSGSDTSPPTSPGSSADSPSPSTSRSPTPTPTHSRSSTPSAEPDTTPETSQSSEPSASDTPSTTPRTSPSASRTRTPSSTPTSPSGGLLPSGILTTGNS